MMLHMLYANGDRSHHVLVKEPTHEWLEEKLGGSVERIPFFTQWGMFNCEAYHCLNAYSRGMPVNMQATEMWRRLTHDAKAILRGDVLIITGKEERE